MPAERVHDDSLQPPVRGFLHRPHSASSAALALTHSAGGDCQSPLLVQVAETFSAAGIAVLRCDLPFRQKRAHGAPFRSAEEDRAGLRNALAWLRGMAPGRLFLGGHSYGGRQASMLAAEDPTVADGLLLLSYPLHPPKKPLQLRTAHFPSLRVRSLFVHGARDGFGSVGEMESAIRLIPAPAKLVIIENAGHDLRPRARQSGSADVAQLILQSFNGFFAEPTSG